MKQYIHTTDQSVILALNHHSFVITWSPQDPSQIQAYELLPPPPPKKIKPTPPPPSKKKKGDNDNDGDCNDNNNNDAETVDEKDKTNSAKEKVDVVEVDTSNLVEAVASKWNSSTLQLTCAVTRKDKSVCVYHIDSKNTSNTNDSSSSSSSYQQLPPNLIHKSPKRCCTLTIGSIPYKDVNTPPQDIIIVGDMNGDAIAFPTIPIHTPGNVYRHLLGHTASVLTSIKVIQPSSSSSSSSSSPMEPLILTADRDEKVRLSFLYQPWNIHGYLLGHLSFVSDMDVVTTNDYTICASCSGDETIRVWDVITTQELGRIDTSGNDAMDIDEKQDDEVEDSKMSAGDINNGDEGEGNSNENNKTQKSNTSSHVPVRISMNSNGSVIAMIREGLNKVEVYSVTLQAPKEDEDSKKALIERVQEIECPSLPLGISFQGDDSFTVLMKNPSYFIRYTNSTLSTNSTMPTFQTNETCPIMSKVQSIGKELNIEMVVDTLLERDQKTGKTLYTKDTRVEPKDDLFLDKGRKEKSKKADYRRKERKRQQGKEK